MAGPTERPMTAEALQRLPRDPLNRYELIAGEPVRMPPVGGEHGQITATLATRLLAYVKPRRLGVLMIGAGYRLTVDPDTVLAPDVSFVAAARVPAGELPTGFLLGPPDLAVEIIASEHRASDLQVKVHEYLVHGTRLVLVVVPRTRTVTVFHPDWSGRILRPGESLTGGEVLPGFSLPIGAVFAS
jgi:Uma2 family endonuclease